MNIRFSRALALSAGLALTVGFAADAAAQSRSPVDRIGQLFGRSAPDDEDVAPRVDSGASVRIDRLENQVRSMTGQIEQMQFTMRQLQDQLRKFQGDMDFRLQESSGVPSGGRPPARRSEEGVPPVVAQTTPLSGTSVTTPVSSEPTRLRRGDAFDPTIQPNAPGVPRQIGTLPATSVPSTSVAQSTRLPGGPVGGESGVPMDLSGGRMASAGGIIDQVPRTGAIVGTPLPAAGGPPSSVPSVVPPVGGPPLGQPGVVTTPGGTVIASREAFSPKDDFDMATGYLKGGQYEQAEKGYTTFLQKNPKNRLVPEVVYNLGETYFQRGRHREAAEQYLKIAQTYTSSSRAPDAMLRLGQSLGAMGAKDQACAAFRDVGQKYPSASASVKSSADREAKKNAC